MGGYSPKFFIIFVVFVDFTNFSAKQKANIPAHVQFIGV
jgi:hypothetical protein